MRSQKPTSATASGRRGGARRLAAGGWARGAARPAISGGASAAPETPESGRSPPNQNMRAGIKPPVGRISRYGVIPITADQDTAGPMAKTVTDAAIMLGVLEGATVDPNDLATSKCTRVPGGDYTRFLNAQGLKGARIGIPRAFFYEKITPPGAKEPRGGLDPAQTRVMEEAITILKQQGAIIVDPVEIPSIVSTDPQENF